LITKLINRLKQSRRIATRYEKRASNFSAIIAIVSIFLFSDLPTGSSFCDEDFRVQNQKVTMFSGNSS
jgi:hypothetical protein